MRVGLVASELRANVGSTGGSEQLLKASGGNTGNFAFVQALYQHLSPNVEIIPWTMTPAEIRERCDILVMACANQLGKHTDLGPLASTFEAANLPIVAIGLGAQAPDLTHDVHLTDGTRRWVHVLADRAPSNKPNIGVRGEFSLSQIEALGIRGAAVVTGCPSNFLNCSTTLPVQISQKQEGPIARIAVAAGLIYWDSLRKIEANLADLVDSYNGIYVTQHEINMIRIARNDFVNLDEQTLRHLNSYIRPSLDGEKFQEWCIRKAVAFTDALTWMDALSKVDFVVGPRFHGVMLGLQAGTPGLVIAHDSRTFEMCQTMCVPVVMQNEVELPLSIERLRDLYPFRADNFRARRNELGSNYMAILRGAGIQPCHELGSLIN